MPELPEVETTRRGIEPHVVGQPIQHVHVRQPMLRWPVTDGLAQALTGKVIRRVIRRAKYLLFETYDGRMMVHLGMSGSLRVLPREVAPEAHDHLDIVFANGTLLRYRDPRRFGSVFWLPGEESHVLLASLGPEPLDDGFDGEHLYRLAHRRKTAVKTFIMTNEIVVGVGNIYANEALFDAGISPVRQAGRISRDRYDALATAIKDVLSRAILAGGTTLRDFVREDGQPGYFRHDLRVYGRGGEDCVRCNTPLREVRVGQRSTVYCATCQR